MNIGWSNFGLTHTSYGSGNSWTKVSNQTVIDLVQENWDKRIPGTGETTLDRKVLVPLNKPEWFYCPDRMPLQVGMPIQAEVMTRQAGEDPYVQVFITPENAQKWGFKPVQAKFVKVVCYSASALMENGGTRSGNYDWEIVTILAEMDPEEYMEPLTLARNFLEMPGGSKGVYTAEEFAKAIYYRSQDGVKVKYPSIGEKH